MKRLVLCAVLLLASTGLTPARADAPRPVATTIAEGLEHPWGLAFLPGGDFLVTERGGRMWRLGLANRRTEIRGLPQHIVARRQGGLLDVVLHPDFSENNLVYFAFVGRGEGGTGTEIARAALRGDRLRDVEIIFRAAPKMRSDIHFGARLAFDKAGYLFIALGDRMNLNGAQDLTTHWGSIIRLHDDGRVPDDNPFVRQAGGQNGVQDGARPEIYSYGHRNIQGMAFAADGTLWAHEHGPQGGDEVNIIRAGANYGWPVITYGIDYDGRTISTETHRDGMMQPVIHWTPSIAPSGLAVYDGNRFPDWRGDLIVGALAGMHVRRLVLADGKITAQHVLFEGDRVRDVRTGPDGHIYILTDSHEGRLIRLSPP